MRRWEDKLQICLPKGGENKFLMIIGVDILYTLIKRVEKLRIIHEERWGMSTEQINM